MNFAVTTVVEGRKQVLRLLIPGMQMTLYMSILLVESIAPGDSTPPTTGALLACLFYGLVAVVKEGWPDS